MTENDDTTNATTCDRCGKTQNEYWIIGNFRFCVKCKPQVNQVIILWMSGKLNVFLSSMNFQGLWCRHQPALLKMMKPKRTRKATRGIQVEG